MRGPRPARAGAVEDLVGGDATRAELKDRDRKRLVAAVARGARLTGIPYLKWTRRQALDTYLAARLAESFVAAEKSLTRAQSIASEIDKLEERTRAAAAAAVMSEDAFVELLKARVRELATPHLEVAVAEYLHRHPGMELKQP